MQVRSAGFEIGAACTELPPALPLLPLAPACRTCAACQSCVARCPVQSPLEMLLEATKQHCSPDEVEAARDTDSPFSAITAAAWRAAQSTGPLLSDLLAVLMQSGVQVGAYPQLLEPCLAVVPGQLLLCVLCWLLRAVLRLHILL